MRRRTILSGLAFILALAASVESQSAVTITADPGTPTPGLAGFKTYKVTATSDVAGEYIAAVDFIGDPDNNDPATARGFFGAMSQRNPFGLPTVFADNNGVMAPAGFDAAQDSQFSVVSTSVNAPAGFFKESANSLRAFFGKDGGLGESMQLAQLVIPDASAGTLNYRGAFTVFRGGTFVDLPEVTGSTSIDNFPPIIQPIVKDIAVPFNEGELANLQLLATDDGLPPDQLDWSDLVFDGPGKNILGASDPQLNGDGIFSWNPIGWKFGQYKFTATVGDGLYVTTDVALTVNLRLFPEPTSCVLMGLACFLCGLFRWRFSSSTLRVKRRLRIVGGRLAVCSRASRQSSSRRAFSCQGSEGRYELRFFG